ncbi:MAG: MarR family winged helix-turn-helix transcriptional regulator [Methanocorpusculum sp.]|nr:MarR family winged helix-turn-helix transcriptional regulator [Methanocorpusculum sp.]
MNYEKHIPPEIAKVSNLIKRKAASFFPNENFPTLSQGKIMHYLVHNRDRDVYQKDIEEIFFLRRSTATGILQLMEENGLIIRERVKNDTRLKKITLTEKALEYDGRISSAMSELEKLAIRGISDEDLKTFYRVIDKIKENLS